MLLFEIISLANNSDSLIGALVYIDAYTDEMLAQYKPKITPTIPNPAYIKSSKYCLVCTSKKKGYLEITTLLIITMGTKKINPTNNLFIIPLITNLVEYETSFCTLHFSFVLYILLIKKNLIVFNTFNTFQYNSLFIILCSSIVFCFV